MSVGLYRCQKNAVKQDGGPLAHFFIA
jgi:hypothetical protein